MAKKELRFEPGLKTARHKSFNEYLDGGLIAPINIEISPTGRCNAACDWCFYRQNPEKIKGLDKIDIDESTLERTIREFHKFGVRSISWTGGGEPTLHPSFYKFSTLAYEERIKQGMFTNGIGKMRRFDPTKFDWIRVSKTNLDWDIENLKYLRSCKTLGLCINYRGKEDDDIVDKALEVGENIGVDYIQVRPALKIGGAETKTEVIKKEHPLLKITNYKFTGIGEERNYNLCEGFHFIPFIWQDGKVDVCGYHREDPRFNLGSIYEKSFSEIMEKAPVFVPVTEDCQICCKLNSINSLIANMRRLEDLDFP
jgi:MoaA/NifB/PqqE/SkfB family radical SAM enzyme